MSRSASASERRHGRGRAAAAALLGVAGGLTLAGGTSAAWLRVETARDVGGVAVTEVQATSGVALAPQGLPLGLVAAAVGLALLVLPGGARRVAGIALVLAGLAAVVFAAVGLARAPAGRTAGAAFAAVGGAVVIIAAGVLVLRPAPRPRLPARYDLGGDDDDEWRLASGEEDAPQDE